MAEEVTQEEIEHCYQFGKAGESCRFIAFANYISDVELMKDEENLNLDTLYQDFRQKAQTYNIVLPEQLPEGRRERFETLEDQISSLDNHFQGQNKRLKIAFHCGMLLERLKSYLYFCIHETSSHDTNIPLKKLIEEIALALQNMAQQEGIDIDEELRTVVSETQLPDRIDINRIVFDLKRKFCNLPTNEAITSTKRSEVDPTRIINNQRWVISLVRLPDRGNNEHAFLVLEAKTGITSKICFIDFVAAQETDLFLPGIRDGKVRIWSFSPEEIAGSSSNLLFQCPKRLMDVRENERLLHMSWSISKTSAEVFLKNVEEKQKKPPKYNILGDTMLAGSSASSSSEDIGHNCFSFARQMLLDLNDPYIQIPSDKLGDWIISATSRLLVDPEFERHKRQMSRFPMLFAFLAGLVVSYIIFRLLP